VGEVQIFTSSISQEKHRRVTGTTQFENYKFWVDLRNCIKGEAITVSICNYCQWGTYSLEENANACKICPDHAQCEYYYINVTQGYWRPHLDSEEPYPCFFPGACLGGYESECATGYEGRLCHECIYQEGNPDMQFTR